jgi:hypothetical protein
VEPQRIGREHEAEVLLVLVRREREQAARDIREGKDLPKSIPRPAMRKRFAL